MAGDGSCVVVAISFFARAPGIQRFDKVIDYAGRVGSGRHSSGKNKTDFKSLSRHGTSLLAYHCEAKHIMRIRRGLYATIPPTTDAENLVVDAFLIASKAAPDAIIAYYAALSFHGLAYSSRQTFTYLTKHKDTNKFTFQGSSYTPVQFPSKLQRKKIVRKEVEETDYRGGFVSITSVERTIVDCFDKIDLAGGIEELWASLDNVTYLRLGRLIEYASELQNATTIAKSGFYLQLNQERLHVSSNYLQALKKLKPKTPQYMFRSGSDRQGTLQSDWNLSCQRAYSTQHCQRR